MKYLLCKQAINHVTTTNKKYEVVSEDDKWWSIYDDQGLRHYVFKASCPNWEKQQE